MKSHKHLNSLINRVYFYAHPLKKVSAYLIAAFGIAGMPTLSVIEANTIAKENGVSLKHGYAAMSQNKKNKFIRYGIFSFIICALLSCALLDKSAEQNAAKCIIKRLLKKMAKNDPELRKLPGTKINQDIADLIASYLTKAEKQEILITARDLAIEIDLLEHVGDFNTIDATKLNAFHHLEDIITNVFTRNPELEKLIAQIAKGQTMYNPQMFSNEKQY